MRYKLQVKNDAPWMRCENYRPMNFASQVKAIASGQAKLTFAGLPGKDYEPWAAEPDQNSHWVYVELPDDIDPALLFSTDPAVISFSPVEYPELLWDTLHTETHLSGVSDYFRPRFIRSILVDGEEISYCGDNPWR